MTPDANSAKSAKDTKIAKPAKPAKPATPAKIATPAKPAKDAKKQSVMLTQLRRAIDKKQQLALDGLGLRRIRHQVSREDTPSIRGLILKVRHLVEVTDSK